MKYVSSIDSAYSKETTKNEDAPVVFFLESLPTDRNINYLELGSGLGRFALIAKSTFPHFTITCLELNQDLTFATKKAGLKTINANVLKANLKPTTFDIIHCSHLIEHFCYPDAVNLLDKMESWLKPGGYLIIRSPLLHGGFYDDIDHVRPYPPTALQNYFYNPQQQKTGKGNLVTKLIWHRSEAIVTNNMFLRTLYQYLWILFRWPTGKPNGYIMIFQKK